MGDTVLKGPLWETPFRQIFADVSLLLDESLQVVSIVPGRGSGEG